MEKIAVSNIAYFMSIIVDYIVSLITEVGHNNFFNVTHKKTAEGFQNVVYHSLGKGSTFSSIKIPSFSYLPSLFFPVSFSLTHPYFFF